MTAFLLAISLLLNGIAIFLIIILYARQNRLHEVEKTQEKMAKDMEEMISSYLYEMKEENEAFINQFKQIRANSSKMENRDNRDSMKTQDDDNDVQRVGNDLFQKTGDMTESEWTGKVDNTFKKQAVKAYKSASINKEESSPISLPRIKDDSAMSKNMDQAEKDQGRKTMSQEEIYRDLFVNQVKLLQKQGLSIDEIAKKLNRGRTEIELLLKFS